MGSEKEREERETMKEQRRLMAAKTKSYENNQRLEDLFQNAMRAIRSYSGGSQDDEDLQ